MKLPKCQYCDENAVWKRPWDNATVCLKHFNKAFMKRVQRTVNKYNLFDRNEVIAVGLSGGKDSVVLLETLVRLQSSRESTIIAVSIDEGIENYREDGLKFARMTAKRLGVEHYEFSFKENFGYDLDEVFTVLKDKELAACAYCGPFRRKSLNLAAQEVGATKLATGHNADDEAQTFMMNVLRGDLLKTLHSNPVPTYKSAEFVNRVKPFRRTSEMEIVLYANLNNLPYQRQSCPYAVDAHRGKIRDLLLDLMVDDPSVVFSIVKSSDKLHEMRSLLPEGKSLKLNKPILACKICKNPSNQDLCNSCNIIREIEERS
jgi:uncharacterized protein (TIGR00269 family)